ncbi:hypothetical protein [Methylobacterium symbioticum]|nr:hypothetical protein [Methylobacterium symbioticum]
MAAHEAIECLPAARTTERVGGAADRAAEAVVTVLPTGRNCCLFVLAPLGETGDITAMQKSVLSLFAILMSASPGLAQDELRRIEQAWHRCLREAYMHQPAGQSQAGDQRNALDECQEREDTYVAAVMAAQAPGAPRRDQPAPTRSHGWASSVAAYVLDPISAWLGRSKH